jgi:NADH-quinone oxidoreductase subunit H
LTALLFLGGWHFPWLPSAADSLLGSLLGLGVLLIKVGLVVGLIIVLRWALPRFRFDQLMGLAWKGLIPMALINLLGVAVVLTFGWPKHLLLITAIIPWFLAYYSAAQFNASMANVGALTGRFSNAKAVTYE